jgi:spermidine/putrescine transport system permease protein
MATLERKQASAGLISRLLRAFRGSNAGPVLGLISPAALWLLIFFLAPLVLVLLVSFGERGDAGQVVYSWTLKNYARFFGKVGDRYLYVHIFVRSLGIALLNTLLCVLVGYPLAYFIARQAPNRRNVLLLLVMIPFWTNFLVRTYAWMVILRDTGIINNLFLTLGFIAQPLPLLYNQGAVIVGLFYGYLPFMVLPLYASIEKLDLSVIEAAHDLGANALRTFLRVVLPLTKPGIVAGSIIVFIPSIGAYVTPDLRGGAKVTMVGNLLQQQFLKVRDWPFGSAVGFILMLTVLAATLFYFRSGGETL